ncbi:MAG: type II toxin-antitoxin system RelE/ParE family toxin [gamma proteobacterium symbiont of Taylorina sp.]|nr:type II toxin-antitoxin system RelE/ParE family toxin [gamma proteobacterium symbiont of Taylorina sp.]
MPQVIVSEQAILGMERCRQFLKRKNPLASKRAAHVIKEHFILLETTPKIGRLIDEYPELRELVIEFGDSGYLALYSFDNKQDQVLILAFRHQREVEY